MPRLGVYNGNPYEQPDEKTYSQFGSFPELATTYYQPDQPGLNLAYETARINRGTSPMLTITTKGTQRIAGIAAGNTADLAWLDTYIAALKKLAQLDPTVPVYATIEHEFKPKIRDNLVTGASANPTTYGQALSVFYRKAHAAHPNIITTYWMAGYDRAIEGAVGQAFTTHPKMILFDPYAKQPTQTLADIATGTINWIKAQTWYRNQPLALGEFGMAVTAGDTAMAKFFRESRTHMKNVGLQWGVFFNRPRDVNTLITNGNYPQAVNGFRTALQSR